MDESRDNNFMQTSFIFYLDCIVEIESTCYLFFFENFPLCTIPPRQDSQLEFVKLEMQLKHTFPGI